MAHLRNTRLSFDAQQWLKKKNVRTELTSAFDESQLKPSFVAEARAVFAMLDTEHVDTILFGRVLRALKYCKLQPRAAIKSIKRFEFAPHDTKIQWRDFLRIYHVAQSKFDAKARAAASKIRAYKDIYSFHDYMMEYGSSELRKVARADISRGINRFRELFGSYYMRPFTPPSQLRDQLYNARESDRSKETNDALPAIDPTGTPGGKKQKPQTLLVRGMATESTAEKIRRQARMNA